MVGVSRLSARSILCPGHLLSLLLLEAGDRNSGPLLLNRDPGSPNLGIASFSNSLATSAAVLVLVGKASTHPENASISTEVPEFA